MFNYVNFVTVHTAWYHKLIILPNYEGTLINDNIKLVYSVVIIPGTQLPMQKNSSYMQIDIYSEIHYHRTCITAQRYNLIVLRDFCS